MEAGAQSCLSSSPPEFSRSTQMRPSSKLNSLLLLAAVFLGIAGQLAPAIGFAYDRNIDRPGGDYTSSEVPGNDPRVCASRCEIES